MNPFGIVVVGFWVAMMCYQFDACAYYTIYVSNAFHLLPSLATFNYTQCDSSALEVPSPIHFSCIDAHHSGPTHFFVSIILFRCQIKAIPFYSTEKCLRCNMVSTLQHAYNFISFQALEKRNGRYSCAACILVSTRYCYIIHYDYDYNDYYWNWI